MTADTVPIDPRDTLSKRSRELSQAPAYADAYRRCVTNPFDAQTNPNGVINLGVAENTLSHETIAERLQQVRSQQMAAHTELFGYAASSDIAPLK